jgi:hypothetical protein
MRGDPIFTQISYVVYTILKGRITITYGNAGTPWKLGRVFGKMRWNRLMDGESEQFLNTTKSEI